MAPKKAKWASGIEMQALNRTCDLGLAVGIDLRGNAVPLRGRFKADQPVRKDAHGHGSRGARLTDHMPHENRKHEWMTRRRNLMVIRPIIHS